MRSTICAVLAAISVSFMAPVSGAWAQSETASTIEPVPLSEYGKLPDVERTALSPSGKRTALVTTIRGERVLLAIENQTKLLTSIAVNDLKVRSIEWVNEDRILITSSQTENLGIYWSSNKGEFSVARVISISGDGDGEVVFANVPKLVNTVIGEYGIRQINGVPHGFYAAFEMVRKTGSRTQYEMRGGSIGLYRVNLETMSTSKVGGVTRTGVYRDWLIDADGEVAVILDVEANTGNWQLLSDANGEIASGKNPAGAIGIVGFNTDGSGVILSERTKEDIFWSKVPLQGGSREPFLNDLHIDRAFLDPRSGRLIGYLEGGESERVSFSNPAHQEVVEKIRKTFSNFQVRLVDWTSDLGDVIVRTRGNRDSGTYYAVNLGKKSAKAIAYERLNIGPSQVGPISTFEYSASDGLEMEGILTLPPHKEAKDLPVIVLPHGGPHNHDVAEFDWWAQAFASRGYAVFQPNFRGSTNDTTEFFLAGFGEWGRKMQTDKSDGLAALAEAGIVDKDRACIVGASYGGFAALAGVTLQQGIYRCAVSVNGVSDIGEKYGIIRGSSARILQTAREQRLGPRETWKEVSPLRFADKADAPIMLIHGVDDTVVEYKHSSKMADRLKDAGKPYELVKLNGEDHWLSLSETRQKMLENAVRWVEKYNPAD